VPYRGGFSRTWVYRCTPNNFYEKVRS
jgi:hypothetical protein